MEVCLVFTPDNPKLYALNPSAWLIMELCDGRTWASLDRAFYAAIEPLRSREAARVELKQTVDELMREGIIERIVQYGTPGRNASKGQGER
jgi:hypothetical protein